MLTEPVLRNRARQATGRRCEKPTVDGDQGYAQPVRLMKRVKRGHDLSDRRRILAVNQAVALDSR